MKLADSFRLLPFLAALLCHGGSLRAADTTGQQSAVDVHGGRPVAAALQVLSARHGYLLTYEDPLYVYDGDVEDVTDRVRRTPAGPRDMRVLVPRGGAIRVEYETTSTGEPVDLGNLIERLLHSELAQTGSRFRFFRDGDFVHVVPARTRSRAAAWVPQSSVLDARITIPRKERSVLQLWTEICQALSKAAGTRVEVGAVPLKLFFRHKVDEGADNEVARDVVVRVLKHFRQKLTWHIYYGPDVQYYAFNVLLVGSPRVEEPESTPANQNPGPSGPFLPGMKTDQKQK